MQAKRVYPPTNDNDKPDIPVSAPLALIQPCIATEYPDGSLNVQVHVELDIAKRLKSRAGSMDLSRYIWENVLKRALWDSVY